MSDNQPSVADAMPASASTGHAVASPPDDSRARARTQIVSIWSDRLQLASVLATFFTSIDSLLFSLSTSQHDHSNTGQLMTAAFAGALVFHAAAAIISYVAAFVLIQFKLSSARAMAKTTRSAPPTFHSPPKPANSRTRAGHHEKLPSSPVPAYSQPSTQRLSPAHAAAAARPSTDSDLLTRSTSFVNGLLHALSTNPSAHIYIELVRPFRRTPRASTLAPEDGGSAADSDDPETNIDALRRLLLRCNAACSAFILLGFALLITGVVSFAWAVLDRAVSIFTSACVATAIAVAAFALQQ